MKPLDPSQPLPADEPTEKKPKAPRQINVSVLAHFPLMKPSHRADVSKQGQGSNVRRAVNDAVNKIFADDRLKGKRANVLTPFKLTVASYVTTGPNDE
jgi:hypothetical protein